MRLKLLAAAAALAVSTALPAAAQFANSADINAAFERGRTSGATPLTRNELVRCAAYWYVWMEFAEEEFGGELIARLDPGLQFQKMWETLEHWNREALTAFEVFEDGEERFVAAAEDYIKEAWAEGEGIAWGDSYLYAEILGACALPAED